MSIVLETKENEPQSSEIIKYLSDSDIKQEPQNDDELVKEVQNYTKEQILYLIEISSKCERFQHVIFAYENLYTLFPSTFLSLDELSPLETSLKIFVAQKQKNLNILYKLYQRSQNKEADFEDMDNDNQFLLNAITLERKKIEEQINYYVNRYLKVIDNFILNNITVKNKGVDREIEVFLYRMKGDINKYLSQIESDDAQKKIYLNNAKNYYLNSYNLATQYMKVSDLSSLSTAVAYVKFLVYFGGNKGGAKNLLRGLVSKEEIISLYSSILSDEKEKSDLVKELFAINNELNNDK